MSDALAVPPGLAIREGLDFHGHRPPSWRVVHELTGMTVVRDCRTCKEARDVAERLGPVCDWTRPGPEVVADAAARAATLAAQSDVWDPETKKQRARP